MSDIQAMMARRERLLGPNVTAFYQEPVHIVKGEGVWLWDADGRQYLDCYNNVPHVGHCHPKVVAAIAEQAATLNTHTRYLHEGILDYVEALTAKFDASLTSAIMVCSGSEANDIALRMAQAATGKTGIIATDMTYHGNTALVSQLSTRKPPIGGFAPNLRHVTAPDSLRPEGGQPGQPFADAFAAGVEAAIASLDEAGFGTACLIICPFFANEGFPDLPKGFLDKAIAAVRRAGGVIVADEVQPGFGRLGSHWWGHERAGFNPEIVTIGKPMGNGHPVAAVVAGQDTLAAFRNAFGYFNTFGGNPVSCAAAMAVLEIIEEEGLVENARTVGDYALAGLRELARAHPVIGDVRGSGLFFGAEMVLDSDMTPAGDYTGRLVEGMKARGILLNRLGKDYATLKIRPPMVFSRDNADQLIDALSKVLAETPVAP
ncbi:MAG: aminotransferase class III-fold pyridoxal phosphate-dependent enzyme [Rhodobacteraceae bacterium]|nr:aminotransferase class III-fold pyridoxal phosphate-dependent enzyme [Paracoccaceae bacterium]